VHCIAMSANARRDRGSRLFARSSVRRNQPPLAGRVRLSQLSKLRECEQVAAVCYRVRHGVVEFLLVQTRGSGRWTFPKGSAEKGLTHAQAAALEAFEEAGVHGRIEQASFTTYLSRKREAARKSATKSAGKGLAVNAHLCQVLRLGKPKESNRNRTWFSVEETKRHLREGRERYDAAEFARVVDRAAARIYLLRDETDPATDPPQQIRAQAELRKDALQKVQFDFAEGYGRADASFMPYIRRRLGNARQTTVSAASIDRREVLQCEVLQFSSAQEARTRDGFPGRKKHKALGTGATQ
jgi:8-oxo-dGTP pyrophosphatase MutT (NUDIX family)